MTTPAAHIETISRMPVLGPRDVAGNKGNFGRVLVVAGSRGMSGAGVLAAGAALRAGAGLVRLAVPQEILAIVAAANPCYLTAGLDQNESGQVDPRALPALFDLAGKNDVIALGPGLGSGPGVTQVVVRLLAGVDRPLVLDADGLNAVQNETACLKRKQPLVLTPHPGEFARLVRSDVVRVQANREELATRFAAEHGVVLVLKGHGTIVTDGRRIYRNATGNPGMATGGTGDVLTGMIAAFLGQHLEAFAAAQLAAYLHGVAGDLARDDLGEVSLIASDLLSYIPRAFRHF
jgi:ADP-dependent NAD(P)H-hydrate dehydratase